MVTIEKHATMRFRTAQSLVKMALYKEKLFDRRERSDEDDLDSFDLVIILKKLFSSSSVIK
jgi:hypothetical protein